MNYNSEDILLEYVYFLIKYYLRIKMVDNKKKDDKHLFYIHIY